MSHPPSDTEADMKLEELLIDLPRRNMLWIVLLLFLLGAATMLVRGCEKAPGEIITEGISVSL